MSEVKPTIVDQNQIKFNMTMNALLLMLGYVLNSWIYVAITVVCQFATAAGLSIAPYRLLYTGIALPTGMIKPNKIPDHHTPHRFGALVGGIFNLIGVCLILNGMTVSGWIFVAIVFVLNLLNLFLGFCGGCFTYHLISKLGIPGFVNFSDRAK